MEARAQRRLRRQRRPERGHLLQPRTKGFSRLRAATPLGETAFNGQKMDRYAVSWQLLSVTGIGGVEGALTPIREGISVG